MKLITKKIHAFLDYPVAISLIILPFILGLGVTNVMALYLSVVTGVAALILTLLTDHHLGVFKVVPYSMHLMVDFLVAIVFIIAPFIFSFQGLESYYYWVIGGTVLLVVAMHKNEIVD